MTDTQTLDVYADRAKDYADRFAADGASETEEFIAFTNALPPSGRVLDWGCGPGHWSAQFQRAGFDADATDASPEMAAVARERFGINVRVEPFDALDSRGQYHGIWAHFSLLHAPRADFASHLGRAMRALKPGGHLLLGLKLGAGEERDKLGRFYAYYTQEELQGFLAKAGFSLLSTRTGSEKGLAGDISQFIVLLARTPEHGVAQ